MLEQVRQVDRRRAAVIGISVLLLFGTGYVLGVIQTAFTYEWTDRTYHLQGDPIDRIGDGTLVVTDSRIIGDAAVERANTSITRNETETYFDTSDAPYLVVTYELRNASSLIGKQYSGEQLLPPEDTHVVALENTFPHWNLLRVEPPKPFDERTGRVRINDTVHTAGLEPVGDGQVFAEKTLRGYVVLPVSGDHPVEELALEIGQNEYVVLGDQKKDDVRSAFYRQHVRWLLRSPWVTPFSLTPPFR